MRILLVLLMASLLLFAGCPQDDGNGPGTVPGTPGGSAVPPQEGPGGEAPGEQEPQESATPDEFASWDMEVLMALGQPVHCTTTYADSTLTAESELYFMGEKMYVESVSTMEGETYETRMILVGNVSYISMDGQTYGLDEDCDWIKMDFERLNECVPEEVMGDAEESTEMFDMSQDYESTPSDFNCGYGTFGEEKFSPQGKVCDLTEEMCEIYEMFGNGQYPGAPTVDESLCDGLTGDDYDSCMQAVAAYAED
jgi:hypothetical protein